MSLLFKRQQISEFEKWLRTAAINPAHKTSFWKKLFGSAPKRPAFKRKEARELAQRIHGQILELEKQLNSADDIATTKNAKENIDSSSGSEMGGTLGPREINITGKVSEADRTTTAIELQEVYRKSKTDFLHRHILDYQNLFRELSKLSSGDAFLFLDDLYHIRRSDQPYVVDYFHRIAKGSNLWLKMGTIRIASIGTYTVIHR